MPSVRLNKYLAQHLNIGRRQADELIERGEVLINSQPAQLGNQITSSDTVTVKGKLLAKPTKNEQFLYVLLDKPVGYVCSRRQQGSTPTIYSLLPATYQHLKPAGRLDKDTSGLLLLTNDGDLAHKLTHPSFQKNKEYDVRLDKALQPLHHQMITDIGIDLPDGKSRLQLERSGDDHKSWHITMHEGRNRQIRRTFAALGYTVVQLRRLSFGQYHLNMLHGATLVELSL